MVALQHNKRKTMHKSAGDAKGGRGYNAPTGAPVSDEDPEFDPDEGKAEIIIGKHRNGPVGTIKLGFQPEYARFTNLRAKITAAAIECRFSRFANGADAKPFRPAP